jgi:hypothetical protein
MEVLAGPAALVDFLEEYDKIEIRENAGVFW